MRERTTPVFVYGTLIFGPVLDRVLTRRPEMCRAAAPGFAARKMPGATYPGMVAVDQSVAGGVLLLELTEVELSLLDDYEGPPYRREIIAVVDDLGRVVEAFADLVDDVEVTDQPWTSREFFESHLDDFLVALDAASLSGP